MLLHALARLAGAQPEFPLVEDGDLRLSAAEFSAAVDRFAAALAQADVGPGERVALLSRNSAAFLVAFLGTIRTGAILVPLNTRLAPAEWEFMINDSTATVLLASDDFIPALDRLPLPGVRLRHGLGSAGTWPRLSAPDGATPPPPPTDPEDDALQLYTSGTTGHPKGAVLSHRALSYLTVALLAAGFRTQDRVLVVLPLFHIFGVALIALGVGAGSTLCLMDEFNPASAVRALSEGGITATAMVPAMIQACVFRVPQVGELAYPSLRLVVYGGSPIAEPTLRAAAAAWRCGFTQAYGMTEIAPITLLDAADHAKALTSEPALLRSAGRIVPGLEMQVLGPDESPVPPGTTGEVVARGPLLMNGYWRREAATAESTRGGWMHTGDAGYIDDRGYLFLQDRFKDLIVSGGENIYPAEIERAIASHPAVSEVAVIGVPDSRWGEAVRALVVLREGATLTAMEVMAYCQANLAGFKRPRAVDFLDQLPRNATGKVLRWQLREPFWRGHHRRIAGS